MNASIIEAFSEVDVDVTIHAITWGSTELMIAGVIVITAPLTRFFEAFLGKAGEDAYVSLKKFLTKLTHATAVGDHHFDIEVENDRGGARVELPTELPDEAYQRLLEIKFPAFTGLNPSWKISWQLIPREWVAQPRFDRRLPARRLSGRKPAVSDEVMPLRELSLDEHARIHHIAVTGASVIARQRADVIIATSQRLTIAEIACRMLLSEARIRSITANFNTFGLDSLYARFKEAPLPDLTSRERADIIEIASSSPRESGGTFDRWTVGKLAEFLVLNGIVEDLGHHQLRLIFNEEDISLRG